MTYLRSRATSLLAVAVLLAFTLLGVGATSALAAPYGSTTGGISTSTTDPTPGQPFVISVTGATPGDAIEFVLHSQPVTLGTFTAAADGTAGGSVTIPSGFSGQHTVIATDKTTGQTWSIGLTLASAPVDSGNSNLPNTGTAIVGLGVLVLVLLAGGAGLLLLGRRRLERTR